MLTVQHLKFPRMTCFHLYSFLHFKSEQLDQPGLAQPIDISKEDAIPGVEHLGQGGTHGRWLILLTLVSTETWPTLHLVGEEERAMFEHAAVRNHPFFQGKGTFSEQLTVPARVCIVNSEIQLLFCVDLDLSKVKSLLPFRIIVVVNYGRLFLFTSVWHKHRTISLAPSVPVETLSVKLKDLQCRQALLSGTAVGVDVPVTNADTSARISFAGPVPNLTPFCAFFQHAIRHDVLLHFRLQAMLGLVTVWQDSVQGQQFVFDRIWWGLQGVQPVGVDRGFPFKQNVSAVDISTGDLCFTFVESAAETLALT